MIDQNPRYMLAAARIALRAAEDAHDTLKAIICGQAQGTNDTQRKASAAELLYHSADYSRALGDLRSAQAAVDHAAAAVAVYEDDLRRDELAARERLAEALMGKRADNAAADSHQWGACTCDECRAARADTSVWRNGGDF